MREEQKDLGNLNTQEKQNEYLKFEFDNPPEEKIQLKNSIEYRDTIQTGRIPIETKDDKEDNFFLIKNSVINDQNEEKEELKNNNNNNNDDNKKNNTNNINDGDNNNNNNNEDVVKKHDPPYWNESNENDLETLIFDISDNKSDNIFKLFNDVRINIENYRNEFENNEISYLINEVEKKEQRGNYFIKNESFYYQLRECLLNFTTTPMSNEEKNEKILEDDLFKKFNNKAIYSIECPIDNENDAVWNLLKNYKDEAIDNILTNKIDYCVICAFPIKNSYNMEVIFLFLSN